MGRPKKPAPPWSPTYEDWSPPLGSYPCTVENPRATFVRNLRKILDEYRRRTGHGTKYVERMSGLGSNTVFFYKIGKRFPEPECLQKLAQFFGIPVDTFFRTDL